MAIMTDADLLKALFARFGVALSAEEAGRHADLAPREAILLLLANREISARFDAAHGRPPEENDIDALHDLYATLEARHA
ncbi:hypothetical protein [Rhabdaerophilum sp. SD176]|uniref:hypothetical protein n=1 Tax=Rhabdaerophilum sp. SD176 TaxID=2983548 RepID=UPI0024E026CA|nr:hypothetical protein [Rhabdaerophilum sp. SD176]